MIADGSFAEVAIGDTALEQVWVEVDDKALGRVEAMINSMTIQERRDPSIIDGSRRKRISSGSGTTVQDVNRLLKQFFEMRKMLRGMKKGRRRGMMPFPGAFN